MFLFTFIYGATRTFKILYAAHIFLLDKAVIDTLYFHKPPFIPNAFLQSTKKGTPPVDPVVAL